MKGHPKYKVGDIVSFNVQKDVRDSKGKILIKAGRITGEVRIVDAYGAIGCSDVSYDVFDEKHKMLWKHIEEGGLRKEDKE